MSHTELRHFGVKGMRWGHRKSPEAKAARFQKKANETAEKVRAIGANAKTDGAGNTYMTRGDVSKANQLIRKHQKYQGKAQRYQAVADKAKRTSYPKSREREYKFSYKRAVGTLAVGAVGVTIASLIRPTANLGGNAIRDKVQGAAIIAAAKRSARKNFQADAEEFAKRRAAAVATNTAANLAKETFAPW